MIFSSSFSRAHRKELYHRLARVVGGAAPAPLPSFGELRTRLRLYNQTYVGLRTIEVVKIVGTVDRAADFGRDFLPRSSETKTRWEQLEHAFPTGAFPPISVYQVNDVYFVIDGNHRVALAKQRSAEFIDADVTEIHTDLDIDESIDFDRIIYLQQERQFMEESGLARARPVARMIDLTRPQGFAELLDLVKVHGYDMMIERGEVLNRQDIAADWYDRVYLPAVESIRWEKLPELVPDSTEGDLFLWVLQRRREHVVDEGPQSFEGAASKASQDRERRIRVRFRRALSRSSGD